MKMLSATIKRIALKFRAYILLIFFFLFSCKEEFIDDKNFVVYKTDLKNENLKLYWKNKNEKIENLKNLKNLTNSKGEKLIFAMNGGMFNENQIPKGLYIENFEVLNKIDTLSGEGNFYLNPNGVFYLTKYGKAYIAQTKRFNYRKDIEYATQSGPLLIYDDKINPQFQQGSKNLNIRNGVGILKNGNIVLAMSKKEINFYNFATFFKNLGCENALYLDGFVSRAYFPDKNWVQEDGNFGVIIGITKKK